MNRNDVDTAGARWPGLNERKEVPPSALFVSVLALGAAATGNFLWPEGLSQALALFWLLALIPPFLLAYYKGWQGAAIALAAGMVLLIGVEIGGSYLANREIRWWVVSGVIVVLIAVSLGAGVISDRLHRQAHQALNLAHSDPLTGLPNRRILELFLQWNFQAAVRGRQLSIALFDVDGFKHHNDSGGHSAGDEVLRLIARILNLNTRAADLSGRIGGDEFLAVLGDEDSSGALAFADRILRQLNSLEADERVGLSVGIATYEDGMTHWEDLLKAADVALYAAKESGGGRAVIHTPTVPRPRPDISPEPRGPARHVGGPERRSRGSL